MHDHVSIEGHFSKMLLDSKLHRSAKLDNKIIPKMDLEVWQKIPILFFSKS